MKWWAGVALLFLGAYWRRLLLFVVVAGAMAAGILVFVTFYGPNSDPVEAADSNGKPKTIAGNVTWPTPVAATKAPEVVVEPTVAPAVSPTKAAPKRAPTVAPKPKATVVPKPAPTVAPKVPVQPTPAPEIKPEPVPTVAAPSVVEVDVLLNNSRNLGSLEFVLVYDPMMLDLQEVTKAGLAGDALLDSGSRTPGRVWTAIISTEGIGGAGAVATYTFKVLESEAEVSSITLEGVLAHDSATLLDLLAEPGAGEFVADGLSITHPTLNFVY